MGGRKTTLGSWMTGIVHWFDDQTGEGVIKDGAGKSYYVHYSAIDSKKNWKSLKDKQEVEFLIVDDVTFSQVSKVREV